MTRRHVTNNGARARAAQNENWRVRYIILDGIHGIQRIIYGRRQLVLQHQRHPVSEHGLITLWRQCGNAVSVSSLRGMPIATTSVGSFERYYAT